jgi:uncharacterized membrane protein HdeD (DUF308 family)
MLTLLARNWWTLALRGIVAVVFGLAALAWPGITLTILVILLGAYLLVDGVFALIAAFKDRREHRQWWVVLLEAAASIAAGALTLAWPGLTELALLYLVAAWAVITGIFEIVAAIRLREEIKGEWLLALSGILSVLFGLILAIQPGAGALALVWIIALYAIIFGALLIMLGFRLRTWGRTASP